MTARQIVQAIDANPVARGATVLLVGIACGLGGFNLRLSIATEGRVSVLESNQFTMADGAELELRQEQALGEIRVQLADILASVRALQREQRIGGRE